MADSALFCYLTEPHEPITIHYRLFVLKNPHSTIVVDSGLPAQEAHRRGISDVLDTGAALRKVGIEPEGVDTVVLTHLHWDHASNAAIFSRATFVAQRADLEWLSSPMIKEPSIGRFYSDVDAFRKMADAGRFRLLDGDTTIVDGVDAIRVGGHTPGSQMIAVNTTGGKAIVTGDAIPLNRNFLQRIPNGIHLDLREAIGALDRAKQLKPTAIFTGHDPDAMLSIL